MRRHAWFVLIALITWSDLGYPSGGAGVGITSPPCRVGQSLPAVCTFCFQDCELSSYGNRHPDFLQADLTFDSRINTDLDLLYSQSFQDYANLTGRASWAVTPEERRELATEIDGNPNSNNPLGPDYQNRWDVELVFNYYTHGETLYGQFPQPSNFRFDNRFGNLPETERNHVDVYFVPSFELNRDPTTCVPCPTHTLDCGYGCCGTSSTINPYIPWRDDDEDPRINPTVLVSSAGYPGVGRPNAARMPCR